MSVWRSPAPLARPVPTLLLSQESRGAGHILTTDGGWMLIQIDSREQAPLLFSPEVRTEIVGLPCGDYGLAGFSDWSRPSFIVERKSLNDLCGSLGKGRDRFMREAEKLRQFGFRALVIEAFQDHLAMGIQRSTISPLAVFHTLDALSVRAGVHVFWEGDAEGAARKIESLAERFLSGISKESKLLKIHQLQAVAP